MPAELNIAQHKPLSLISTTVAYICWLWIYLSLESLSTISTNTITAASVCGTVVIVTYILIWRKLTGHLFTPFNIFLAFFVVFNFGQCLLWAVGIHTDDEIGKKLVFSTLDADNRTILQSQLLFIICYITLNCGAMLSWNQKNSMQVQPLRNAESSQDARYRYLFFAALILSFAVIPASLYDAIHRFRLSLIYGYGSLYNGEANELLSGTAITILTSMFFPCLVGLLIGSRYDNRVRLVVYGIFLVFAVIKLLGGDRGEWINSFAFLFWADYHFHKKRRTRSIFLLCIIGLLALSIIDALVSIRNYGLTWSNFITALTAQDANPIISMLIEFGHSMGISMILLARDVVFPYGNTYLMSIPTIFGTGIARRFLGIDYVQLHSWFPDYLGIRYGTDFSIIGEALLNFGVYATPLVLLIMGYIIAKIAQLPYRRNPSPLALCLSLSVLSYVVKLARSTLWLVLNSMVYTLIAFCVAYAVIKLLLRSSGKFRA